MNDSESSQWRILLYGQGIALSLACCSASSSTLQKIPGIQNMPLFQIAGGYFFLSFNIVKLKRWKKGEGIFFIQPFKNSSKKTTEDVMENGVDVGVRTERSLLIDKNREACCENQENNAVYSYLDDDFKKEFHYSDEETNEETNEETYHDGDDGDVPRFKLPIFHNIRLHSPWYFYLLLAFLDVQANYFVVLSFRYTTLINTNLLTSLSVISVMATSKIILKRFFKVYHFIGALLVLLGSAFIVSSDLHHESLESYDIINDVGNNYHYLQGDIFAILAALLFGLNDTLAEYCVEHSTVEEYLAMLGTFGWIFSLGESIIFESEQVKEFMILIWDGMIGSGNPNVTTEATTTSMATNRQGENVVDFVNITLIWIIYTSCLVIFYTSASYFLQIADATFLNLSLQSSNMWTMIFSILVQHVYPTPLFYGAVLFIFVGVLMYEMGMKYQYYFFLRFERNNNS